MVEIVSSPRSWRAQNIALAGLIVAAWLILVVWAATPYGALLDHQEIEGGAFSAVLRWPAFLVGWTLMVIAMMLPGSFTTVRSFAASAHMRMRPRGRALLSFVAGYLAVWLLFGVTLYAADTLLHEVVEAAGQHEMAESLVPIALLTLAGLYQLSPLRENLRRRRCAPAWRARDGGGTSGLRAGALCVGACGGTMLVMFALGGGLNLMWMAALTAYGIAERASGVKYLAWMFGFGLLLWAGIKLIAT